MTFKVKWVDFYIGEDDKEKLEKIGVKVEKVLESGIDKSFNEYVIAPDSDLTIDTLEDVIYLTELFGDVSFTKRTDGTIYIELG